MPMSQPTMGTPTRQGLPFLSTTAVAGSLAGLTGYLLSLSLHAHATWAWPAAGAAATLVMGWRARRQMKRHARRLAQAQVVGMTGGLSESLAGMASAQAPATVRALHGMRLLEAAFDQSGAAMVITDALDRVVMVNPAFVTLSGHEAQALLGQPAELVGMAPLRGTHLPELEEALREGRRWGGETCLATAQGDQRDLWLNVSAIRGDGGQRVTHHCRVFQDVNPLKEQLRTMAEQARHDSLTGLPNRRAFGEHLFRAMARTRRHPRTLAIMCVDLDGFKGVNDRHGHQVGDELLVQVARRLQACVRTTDIVCRMGGDEFMLILEGAGTTFDIQRTGQRLLTCLSEAYAISGHHIAVTPSIGAVVHDGREADTALVQRADAAMYAAKHGGKGRLVLAGTGEEPIEGTVCAA